MRRSSKNISRCFGGVYIVESVNASNTRPLGGGDLDSVHLTLETNRTTYIKIYLV